MYKLSKADRQFIEQHRGVYLPDPSWYAVMTHWGRERRIHDMILKEFGRERIDEALLPVPQEQEDHGDKKPQNSLLFGGYVFIHCPMSDEIYMNVAAYPGVFKILGKGFRIPQVILESEMQIFKGVLQSVPQPQLVTRSHLGRTATVTSGLMKGLQGRVIGVSAQFVKLEASFSFLDPGNALVVSVPQNQVLLYEDEPGKDIQPLLEAVTTAG